MRSFCDLLCIVVVYVWSLACVWTLNPQFLCVWCSSVFFHAACTRLSILPSHSGPLFPVLASPRNLHRTVLGKSTTLKSKSISFPSPLPYLHTRRTTPERFPSVPHGNAGARASVRSFDASSLATQPPKATARFRSLRRLLFPEPELTWAAKPREIGSGLGSGPVAWDPIEKARFDEERRDGDQGAFFCRLLSF